MWTSNLTELKLLPLFQGEVSTFGGRRGYTIRNLNKKDYLFVILFMVIKSYLVY